MYKCIFIILLFFVSPITMAQNNDLTNKNIADDFYAWAISSPPDSALRQINNMHELLITYTLQDQKNILFSKNARLYMHYILTALRADRLDLITQLFELFPVWREKINYTGKDTYIGIYILQRFSVAHLLKLSEAGYDASHLEREIIEKLALRKIWSDEERKVLIKILGYEIQDSHTLRLKILSPVNLNIDNENIKPDSANKLFLSALNTNSPSYFSSTKCNETFKIEIEDFKSKIKDQMYDFINKTKPSPGKIHSFKFEQSLRSSCSVDSKFTFEFNNNNELLIHSIDGSISEISADELKRLEVSQSLGL